MPLEEHNVRSVKDIIVQVEMKGNNLPNGESGEHATSQEHANVDGSGLDDGADRDDNAHQLHETNATESIADGSLNQGSNSLTGNVHGNNLIGGW